MQKINTVSGTISPGELGKTLMHEHLVYLDPYMTTAFPGWFDRERYLDHIAVIIGNAKRYGLKTIVDVSTVDMFRQPELLKEIADRCEINIIMATGLFYDKNTKAVELLHREPEYLEELILGEFEKGIGTSGVRPGILKCATVGQEMSADNERILRLIARIHRKAGVPITTHAEENGLLQQDVFEAEGVDLHKVLIGHCNDSINYNLLGKIAERGSILGMDHYGRRLVRSDDVRNMVVYEMYMRGYIDQMVLSHDYIGWTDIVDEIPLHGRMFRDVDWEHLRNHEVQYSMVFKKIIPELVALGIPLVDVEKMVEDTPRRLFEIC